MPDAGDEILDTDFTDLEDKTVNKPIVRLTQAVVQSIPDNTATAITFTTEEEDTDGFHDPVTNNTRITPTVAGWYRFYGSYFSATLTTPVLLACYLRKNNTGSVPPGKRVLNQAGVVSPGVSCTALIEMDGSTDYVEFIALQDSAGATNTAVTGYITSTFECEFVRNS